MDDIIIEPLPEHKQPSDFSENQSGVLEAKHVYLLMKKEYRISRNVRAHWFIANINKIVEINPRVLLEETDEEIAVLSVIPKNPPPEWTTQNCTCFKYKILAATSITLLSRRYRLVFCLDYSSSIMVVNARNGEVMLDRALSCFRKCIEGLTTPFCIPGNNILFKPQLYITVIAHTFSQLLPSQQVLVQGCLLTADNVNIFLDTVQEKLSALENQLAHNLQQKISNGFLGRHPSMSRQVSEHSLHSLHDKDVLSGQNGFSNKSTVMAADISFVNLVRYCILALQLLPENTSSGIVIITDGIVNLSDIHIFFSLLTQLRNSTISCSFLHIASDRQPSCCWGYPTYSELMKFIAVSTFGTYISISVDEQNETGFCGNSENKLNEMNIYHSAFLIWSFHWASYALKVNLEEWNLSDRHSCLRFVPNNEYLQQKQHAEKQLVISLETLISCRLREGYAIQGVALIDDHIQVQLILPWKPDINIIYRVTASWPLTGSLICRYKVIIEGSYEFLHDLSCPTKQPIKSVYRDVVVKKFIESLHSLSQTDAILVHLHSLCSNPISFTIPESVRNGVPLFCISQNSTIPTSLSTDFLQYKFTELWEPVAKLDVNIWQKWMHIHRIGMLLAHDLPLPKHLHLSNINDRYHSVQCRQALAALNALLVEYSSFVLVDNHTYINFIYGKESDKPPLSFYIIRISSKLPCIILRLAFLGGIPSLERNKIVSQLKEKVFNLSFRLRPTVKDTVVSKKNSSEHSSSSGLPSSDTCKCCIPLLKPVEKILIRYDRIPKDLTSPTERLISNNIRTHFNSVQMKNSSMFGVLCPYLFYRRWIWSASGDPRTLVPIHALGRILSTLVKVRLSNGFHFSHCSSGIVNMVYETKMKLSLPQTCFANESIVDVDEEYPCVVQYILFPPHFKHQDSLSEDDDELVDEAEDTDSAGSASDATANDLHIVIECWVEPQHGIVTDNNIFKGLDYRQIPKTIWQLDLDCIATLLTFEQLSLMCQKDNVFTPGEQFFKTPTLAKYDEEARLQLISFPFLINVLLSNCPLSQLFFSTLTIVKCSDELNDGPCNSLLLKLFHQGLDSIHTRQVQLSEVDHRALDKDFKRRTMKQTEFEDDSVPFSKWKCYVKAISSTHVILTLTPDTYDDVILLQNKSGSKSEAEGKYLFPVYVYDCSLAGLIDRVAGGVKSDHTNIIRDYRFNLKADGSEHSCSTKESNDPPLSHGSRNNVGGNRLLWNRHQNNIAVVFSNCYVTAIFLCLQRNILISYDDIRYAMEDICSESSLIIDVTDFLHTICYHSNHWPPTEEKDPGPKDEHEKIDLSFPKTFWSSFSCRTITSVHNLIRANFTSIIHRWFTTVASNPLYFYYNPQKSCDNKLKTSDNKYGSSEEAEAGEMSSSQRHPLKKNDESEGSGGVCDDDECETLGVDKTKNEKEATHVLDDIRQNYNDDYNPPLFINFKCSVKHCDKFANYAVNTLPTCYCDIFKNSYNQTENPDWSSLPSPKDVMITLEILCLTLPLETCSAGEGNGAAMRATSFCSSSPGPLDNLDDEREEGVGVEYTELGDFKTERKMTTEQNSGLTNDDSLDHLPGDQIKAINNCVEEIKWMLDDEKASFARDIHPITENILESVITHVSQSSGRPGCCWRSVPLSFVIEEKPSLKQFEKEFQRVNITGYKLVHEGDYYYISKSDKKIASDSSSKRVLTSIELPPDSILHDANTETKRILEGGDGERMQKVKAKESEEKERQKYAERTRKIHQRKLIHSGRKRKKSLLSNETPGSVDGYEGDGSDCDNEFDIEGDLDAQRLELPRFWLILKVSPVHVDIWFQFRNTEVEVGHLNHYEHVLEQVINHVKATCKIVNQARLLQELHDTRLCPSFLETETSEDVLHTENLEGGKYASRLTLNGMDYYIENPFEKPMEDAYDHSGKHKSGIFSCPVVWEALFQLHSRIKTTLGPSRGTSRGIQALRSVLLPMSVSNRKNMYVYKENIGGAVFYLRLHECSSSFQHQYASYDSQFSSTRMADDGNGSLLSSRSSSMQSLNVIRTENLEEQQSRFRVNSFPEKDQNQDTVSVSSRMSIGSRPRPLFDDAITLSVHGITDVGFEIKDDLVKALQSRLDDAVLEVISLTLARNPMCKLTLEDVQFLQRPSEAPKVVAFYKVAAVALPYLQVVMHYLGHNLVQFLSVPKFIDGRIENQFRRYSETENLDYTDSSRSRDSSVSFLYIRPPEAGNRGIACVVLSLVDGQGNLVQHVCCPRPSSNAFKDGLAIHDFENFTDVELYSFDSKKSPGPIALLQLQIWEKGKVDIDHLIERVRVAIRQSLWDLITEYRVLVAPITETLLTSILEEGMNTTVPEPITPIRVKRPSLPADNFGKQRDRAASPLSLIQPVSSPPPVPQSANLLRGISVSEIKHSIETEPLLRHLEKIEFADKGCLDGLYSEVLSDWMNFAHNLGVSSVFKSVHSLTSRHSVELLLRDFHKLCGNVSSDNVFRTFKMDYEGSYKPIDVYPEERERKQSGTSYLEERVPTSSASPGRQIRYISTARSTKQWLLSCGHLEKENSSEINENKEPAVRAYNELQRFASLSQLSEGPDSEQEGHLIFIPRQRFMLISVLDTQISIFIYNWAIDIQNTFIDHVHRLIDMYNVRSSFLSSIILQKLGLFLNQPVTRAAKVCKLHNGGNEGVCMACRCATADPDMLLKRTPSLPGQSRRPLFQISNFTEILRGNRPHQPVNSIKLSVPGPPDIVIQHTTQMCQIRNADPRDYQKKLLVMWQNRESRATMPISMLKAFSRIEHYCLTPLLFHPLWRNQIASARDHTIGCLPCSPYCRNAHLFQQHAQPEPITPGNRSRHSSTSAAPGKLTPITVGELRQSRKASVGPAQVTLDQKCKCAPSPSDDWHMNMCIGYIGEFIQYLQTFGFVLSNTSGGRHGKTGQMKYGTKDQKSASKIERDGDEQRPTNVLFTEYFHKFLLGGILLLELTVSEPYCGVKLYIFDSMRLRALEERAFNSQFVVAFLDETDKIKVSLHLHSFTYDYHLRCMHAFVSQKRQIPLPIGYHVVGFLDDFLKYYQKSPNFARNLVHQGTVYVGSATKLMLLLTHLWKHDRHYEMRGLKMTSLEDSAEIEHVLVQMSSHKVSYRDGSDVRQTDEFDLSLLVAKDDPPPDAPLAEKFIVNLKYFIILSSCREMFPKSAVEKQPGTFKSVITTALPPSRPPSRPILQPIASGSATAIAVAESAIAEVEDYLTGSSTEESRTKSILEKSTEMNYSSEALSLATSSGNMTSSGEHEKEMKDSNPRGIRQESVNYMGYFSTHEELMHNIMMEQVQEVKVHIERMIERAMVDSQRDSCWERLQRGAGGRDSGKRDDGLLLNYSEFTDLLNLVHKVPLTKYDTRLETFANKMPMNWYQTLVKVFLNKYNDCHRHFTAPDGNTQHVAILSANIYNAFILLSVDLHSIRAEMHVVFLNEPSTINSSIYPLVENVVNTCCFHMWTALV